MGNEIPRQLAQFFRSILMGGALALGYDVARALHVLGGKTLEILLDTFVSIGAAFALFLLIMAEEGELRLFILIGVLGGAVLFFSLVSPSLRPVLGFWIDLSLVPLRLGHKIMRKMQLFFKKVFSFLRGWFTIICTQVGCPLRRGQEHDTQEQKTENPQQQ